MSKGVRALLPDFSSKYASAGGAHCKAAVMEMQSRLDMLPHQASNSQPVFNTLHAYAGAAHGGVRSMMEMCRETTWQQSRHLCTAPDAGACQQLP